MASCASGYGPEWPTDPSNHSAANALPLWPRQETVSVQLAKENGIRLLGVLNRVTVQLFVRDHCTMIAAPVQCDAYVIPEGRCLRIVTLVGELASLLIRMERP